MGPELSLNSPELSITEDRVPHSLEQTLESTVLCQMNTRQVLLEIDNVGRFLAEDGKRIRVDPHPKAQEADIRAFLLSGMFGAILHQRGLFPLHASAVATDKGVVLFAGPSGVGKSTLLAEFLGRGYKMLADDVVNVDSEGRATPAFPSIKLCPDAAELHHYPLQDSARIRVGVEKYSYQAAEHFCQSPLPIYRMYVLNSSKGELTLVPTSKTDTFVRAQNFIHNTYKLIYAVGAKRRREHLSAALELSQKVSVTMVTRPRNGFSKEFLADAIEQDFSA